MLPEKWYIKTDEESNDTVCDWYDKVAVGKTDRTIGNFYCVDGTDKPKGWMHYAPNRTYGYTEITFKQFKQYVLGMKEQEQQKEIVGYRLKDECHEYLPALDCISTFFSKGKLSFAVGSYYYNDFKQAGVLDLWFEPVYKKEETFCVGDWIHRQWDDGDVDLFQIKSIYEERYITGVVYYRNWVLLNDNEVSCVRFDERFKDRKATPEEIKSAQTPQIVVNGYKAEFFDEYVKFGCAKFSKDVFIELNKFRMRLNCDSVIDYSTNTNRGIESVTLGKGTFTKEQIKAIAEYYLNKK